MKTKTNQNARGGKGRVKHRGWNRERSGVKRGNLETFSDVRRACNRFLEDRTERGLMKAHVSFGNYVFGKNAK